MRRNKTEIPENWQPRSDTWQILRSEGVGDEIIGRELAKFADSALAHGRKYKKWDATFRNWCRSPFMPESNNNRSGGGSGSRDAGIIAATNRFASRGD